MPESSPAIAAPATVSRPDPDPTVLTTQALYREINQVKQLLDANVAGVKETLSARITAIDHDLDRLQLAVEQEPAQTGVLVDTLKTLHNEKFGSIQVQFIERDVRTEQTSRDSKVAVDAALQAAKEAVEKQNTSSALAIAKSESATTKQIDTQGILITTATTSLNERIDAASATMNSKIDDLKDRMNRIEGGATGGHQAYGYIVGVAGSLIGIISLLYNILHR